MILLLIALAIGALVACIGTALLVPAIVVLVLSVWSNGVLANFSRANPQEAPNWAALLSMITALASVALIIGGIVLR